MPDLAASAEGLSALAAVRASLGGGEKGDTAVVQAVLAAARAAGPAPAEALAAASAGSADAALVPVSEQEVFLANRTRGRPTRPWWRSTRARALRRWTTRCCGSAPPSGNTEPRSTPSSGR